MTKLRTSYPICCLCLLALMPWLIPLDARAQESDVISQTSRVDKRNEDKNAAKKDKQKFTYIGQAELGAGYNTASSFKFGEFTGLVKEQPFFIGNLQLQVRELFDSSRARYLKLMGTNLGLKNRHIRLEQGNQGRYRVFFDYDQIPHYQGSFPSDTALTPLYIKS